MTIVLHNNDHVLPGYFVEGVFPDGAIGPNLPVHKGPTAFSYCRDIRFHIHEV
jgi:hypothetical protein